MIIELARDIDGFRYVPKYRSYVIVKELDSFEIRNNKSSTFPYHKLLLCYHI